MNNQTSIVEKMQALVDYWEQGFDRRSIFLNCYMMMTRNMLLAVDNGEFADGVWVSALLHRFAEYYFQALEAFDRQPDIAPKVWQVTFQSSRQPETHVIQHLILGVNAHICHDLVFALADLLRDEWATLTPEQREMRYRDHCHVNQIIGQTLDTVQDQVVERYSRMMKIVDDLFISADERVTNYFIRSWREEVWQDATRLVELSTDDDIQSVYHEVIERSLKRASAILGASGVRGVVDLL